MSKTTYFAAFALGAAVGSVAAWLYLKKKYERIAEDEINSVKAAFSKSEAGAEGEVAAPKIQTAKVGNQEEKLDISEYAARLEQEGYISDSRTVGGSEKEKSETAEMQPYVISPDEFGEFEDYETVSLSYYADQVLADENDERVEDVESIIGFESLTHFGEFEDDSVFVRNDRLKCDYEILADQRLYSDVIKQSPHQTEV